MDSFQFIAILIRSLFRPRSKYRPQFTDRISPTLIRLFQTVACHILTISSIMNHSNSVRPIIGDGEVRMNKSLKVIYEHGVLRPLEPVSFQEQEKITVLVLDQGITDSVSPAENCYDAAVRAGIIGIVEDAPHDLSTNPIYMDGFGR